MPSALQALGWGLVSVAGRMKMDEVSIVPLFEALKLPLILREDLVKAMRAQFPETPAADRGFWAFIEWAEERFPALDLEASPQSPELVRFSVNILR
jgi:hypothetical protein